MLAIISLTQATVSADTSHASALITVSEASSGDEDSYESGLRQSDLSKNDDDYGESTSSSDLGDHGQYSSSDSESSSTPTPSSSLTDSEKI